MKMIDVIAKTADLIKEGKTNSEIRYILFNTKGVKTSQIEKVITLIAN